MIHPKYYLVAVIPLLIILHFIHRRLRHSIAHLPGPHEGPWLTGHLPEIFRPENAADAEFSWTKTYGTALRIKGAFGNDILFTADPKALQYILNTSGYNYPKPRHHIARIRLVGGEGIVFAQGAQHAKHRKIMNPAFSYNTIREFLPLFRHTAHRTMSKWKDMITQSENASIVVNIPAWLSRTTLDAIGKAAFDYDFGALDEGDNELSAAYDNLFADTFFKRADLSIAFEALWGYIPLEIVKILQMIPTKSMARLARYMTVARKVAKNLVDAQTQSYFAGKDGGKDVMSILTRANLSEDPKTKLTNNELLSQLTTLMLAGHETTASTTTWALYELAKNPETQRRVREEIKATRVRATQRGDEELSVADLDSMKYLIAVMKETLRYHPIVTFLHREASHDNVIPLSTPQTTKTGQVITSIPVSKGQGVIVSLATYNRLKSIWGEDADVWRAERFLEGVGSNHKTGLGVMGNLATFSSGVRSCIGWRFAMIEMQTFLMELLESFEFSVAPGDPEIVRSAAIIMVPMVKGQLGKAQLPLTVTPIM